MHLLRSIYSTWRKNLFKQLIVDDFRSWKGIELQVASWHLRKQIKCKTQKENVAVLLPTSGLFPVALTAIWSLGKTVVPLNYLLSKDEIKYIMNDSGIDTVVTVNAMLDFLGDISSDINLIKMDEISFSGFPPFARSKSCSDDMLAALLYTSGTSGKPKGVMLSSENLSSNIRQCRDRAGFNRSDIFVGLLPQFHSFGFTVTTLLPLILGAKTIYMARFNPRKVIDCMRKHNPTIMLAIPSMYNAILNTKSAKSDDFSSIRLAGSGGEALPDSVYEGYKQRFNLSLCEGYGLTETSPVTNWCKPEDDKHGSVGQPVKGLDQCIVGADEELLGPNCDGEVRMKGPNIMQGYFNMPDETALVFDEKGYFKSGDMGRFDDDGFLYITGRIKEMLIIGGENVFPREIEEALTKHPSVSAAGVVGRHDASRGEVAVAFVELVDDAMFSESDLRAWCRDQVAQFKVPKNIYHLEELPRNPTGKILRRELSKIIEEVQS